MTKNSVKLNEAQLKKIVVESVKRVLREFDDMSKRNSEEYQRAYDYADSMDWYAYGCTPPEDLTLYELEGLAFDASMETGISKEVLVQAMKDCLHDMGYDIEQ